MPVNEIETRRATVMRGIKEGTMKGITDKVVEQLSAPIAKAILPRFQEAFPGGAHLLQPAVEAALEFVVIMGVAELLVFSAPTAGRLIPSTNAEDATQKAQLLATWLRKYAGERVGEQLIEAATAVFPMVMEQFSAVSADDVATLLMQDSSALDSVTEPAPAPTV